MPPQRRSLRVPTSAAEAVAPVGTRCAPSATSFYAIKGDDPDAPAVCPRCQHPLTRFRWRKESARDVWPQLEGYRALRLV